MKFSFKCHPEIEWLKERSQSSCFYFCCAAASFCIGSAWKIKGSSVFCEVKIEKVERGQVCFVRLN